MRGVPEPPALQRLTRGIWLEDGPAAPATNVHVRRVIRDRPVIRPPAGGRNARDTAAPEPVIGEGTAEIELTIYEGRNRQVRRMLAAIGHPVARLTRISIGDVRLTGLPVGAWRHLTPKEVAGLTRAITTPTPRGEHTLMARTATFETTKGTIVARLDEDDAPITTANFIELAQKGFYDGLTFHRYAPGFVIQGGDPKAPAWRLGQEYQTGSDAETQARRGRRPGDGPLPGPGQRLVSVLLHSGAPRRTWTWAMPCSAVRSPAWMSSWRCAKATG